MPEVDLHVLAQHADCDPRTLLTYFSAGRDRMRPRVRARIDQALAEMTKARRTAK
jgi:hypothetical protein